MVIGAGIAGLSCAYNLAKAGGRAPSRLNCAPIGSTIRIGCLALLPAPPQRTRLCTLRAEAVVSRRAWCELPWTRIAAPTCSKSMALAAHIAGKKVVVLEARTRGAGQTGRTTAVRTIGAVGSAWLERVSLPNTPLAGRGTCCSHAHSCRLPHIRPEQPRHAGRPSPHCIKHIGVGLTFSWSPSSVHAAFDDMAG